MFMTKANKLTDTDSIGDNLGQVFVAGSVSYTNANHIDVSFTETSEGKWQQDGFNNSNITNSDLNAQLAAAGVTNAAVDFGSDDPTRVLAAANSIGAGSDQPIFDFGNWHIRKRNYFSYIFE